MATAATIDVMLRANTATYRAAMLEANQYTQRQLGQVRKEAASTASSLQAMNRAAAGFIGFQAFRSGVGALLDVTKQNQALINSMRASVGSSALAADAMSFVSQTAKELGLDFQSAAEGFQRLTASATATGVAMKDQQELFTELSRAATSMQLAPPIVDRAMTALSQSFSKGRFQAEELRQQLAEAIPGVVPRFQKAVMEMVKGTELADKSFDQLLQGGLLDVQRFLPAMTQAFAEMGSTWQESAGSLQAETNRLGNAWRELKLETSSGIFSDAAVTSVRLMRENLSELAGAATLAAGVVAGRLAGAGIARGVGFAKDSFASRAARMEETASIVQNTMAERANAEQRLVTVAARQNALVLARRATLEAVRETEGTALNAAARTRLERITRNLERANNSLAASQERVRVAGVATTQAESAQAAARARNSIGGLARSAGSGALALAGGPWGIAAMGIIGLGAAYASIKRQTEEAKAAFDEQVKSLDLLAYSVSDVTERFSKMDGGVSLKEFIANWNAAGAEIRKSGEELAEIDRKLQTLENGGYATFNGETFSKNGREGARLLAEMQAKAEELRTTLGAATPEFDKMDAVLKSRLSPSLYEAARAAAQLGKEQLAEFLASLSEADRRAIGAANSIQTMLSSLGTERWKSEVEWIRKSRGEYAAWQVEQGKAIRDAGGHGAMSAQERADFNATDAYMRNHFARMDALKEQASANKASARDSASYATQQENQYQSAIDRINRQIALDREALLLTDDMTAAQRLQVIVTNEMASAKNKLSETEQARVRTMLDEAVAAGKAVAAREAEKKAAEDMLQLQRQLAEAARTRRMANNADLFAIGNGPEAVERMRRMVDLQAEYQRQVEQLNAKAAADPSRKAAYEAQIEELRRFHERGLIEEEEYQLRLAQLRGDWVEGASRGLQRYLEETADIASQIDDLFSNMAKGLEDSIVNFVKTGKLSFKDLADSIIEDIARIAARQMVAGLITGIGQAFGPRVTGFAAGGYTGPGGVLQPAGVVHKGEVVWSQRDVAKAGGVAAVEAMRLGQRGYAGGGSVGVSVPVGASGGISSVTINNSTGQPASTEERDDGNGMKQLIVWIGDIAEKRVGQSIAREGTMHKTLTQKYGLRPQGVMRGN